MEELHDPTRLADRIGRLGTETAYAVALEAKKLAATGRKIYPFHIGDLNFPTPECVHEATIAAMKDGKTGYPPAAGVYELRAALAKSIGEERGVTYEAENVVVQNGGKPVILKFLWALMNVGDRVLYPNPGYPIYESVIRFLGGVPVPYTYVENPESGRFSLDLEALKASITPNTKLLIYNNYSNPCGVASSDEEMAAIAELCHKHDLIVMSDEPYFDIVFDGEKGKSIVALPGMQKRTVILQTFSKSYAMTGWRLGSFIGPKWLANIVAKLATNDEACCTHFIQYGAIAALTDPRARTFVDDMVKELAKRRDGIVEMINSVKGLHCFPPTSTFYLWVNATDAMNTLGMLDSYEDFRRYVLDKTGVSFCTREHFGSKMEGETQRYVRFAFSGVSLATIEEAGVALRNLFGSRIA